MFNLEQGRSQRANGFPITKYLEDCSDAGGRDLFPGVLEESTATMEVADTERRFSTRQSRETKNLGGPHLRGCRILVPQPGIEPVPPALGAWNLNDWGSPPKEEIFFFFKEEFLKVVFL